MTVRTSGEDGRHWSMPGAAPSPDRPVRELRGVVERITFQNAENGLTVALLAPERLEAELAALAPSPRCVG